MYPNTFLRTFWRPELRSQIFVAMSFGDVYERRYLEIIAPAIRSVSVAGVKLDPYRVDASKTGDSILTDIVDGIAHCQAFLADVSSTGYDSKTGEPYRNGNVMYEIGLAVACRQSTEILLVRDDKHAFLFDVSTIPHMYVDFTNAAVAKAQIAEELVARLNQRRYFDDARLRLAVATLTTEERKVLEAFAKYLPGQVFWVAQQNLVTIAALPRLLDKQLLKAAGRVEQGQVGYTWTPLGHKALGAINASLPLLSPQEKVEAKTELAHDPELRSPAQVTGEKSEKAT